MSTLRVYAQFTKGGAGVTPSVAPTVDVWAINRTTNAVTHPVTAAAVTALVASGVYLYAVTSADLTTLEYLVVFTTTDTTVDLTTVPALQQIQANVDVLSTYTGDTPQTGDGFLRLGAPAGASHAADVAAVKTDTAAIKAKTDNLPAAPASTTNITAAAGIALAAGQHVIVDSGTVNTLTNLPAAPTDWLTALAVKADAVAKIQSGLSTFAGGAVASVASPVTVGTNTDKSGYSLAVAPPTAAAIATAVQTDIADVLGADIVQMAATIATNLDGKVSLRALASSLPAGLSTLIINAGRVAFDGSRQPAARNQDAVTAPTYDDCLLGAWSAAFGQESESNGSGSYVKTLPDRSGPMRSFVLAVDSDGNPVTRT